ncbi:DUF418 domain-containing protein [Bacillus cereus group sp. BfR-BA-01347]|uniref:DUF418 domain-containing protein n=1 Tax=Bacillus cereus group sp. BfR-BA-01347 TaxID=2920310 RepID=UPI001F5796CB|nr:DUF418 domain-containing protein [Bacillus cereus group sp. BfR-BA-01347]
MTDKKESFPKQNRMVELDIIRGFALIGIFLVNIFNFVQISGISINLLLDNNWLNIFFTGKFYAIFSLLFGAGAAIFLSRAEAKGKPYLLYIRRMIVLAIIGYLHSLIWNGDVLLPYALVGLVLLALHKIPPKLLFIITVCLQILDIMISILAYDWLYGRKSDIPLFLDVLHIITSLTSFLVYFIEGFTLMKMDVLKKLKSRPTLHKWLIIILSSISVIAVISQILITTPKPVYVILIISQPLLMLTYIIILLALINSKIGSHILYPLQAYGKMAMSNYLGQTAIGIFIVPMLVPYFQPLLILFGVCLITWIMQILVSNVWLKYFYYGPIEWIWRCFTYWRLMPIRR